MYAPRRDEPLHGNVNTDADIHATTCTDDAISPTQRQPRKTPDDGMYPNSEAVLIFILP